MGKKHASTEVLISKVRKMKVYQIKYKITFWETLVLALHCYWGDNVK